MGWHIKAQKQGHNACTSCVQSQHTQVWSVPEHPAQQIIKFLGVDVHMGRIHLHVRWGGLHACDICAIITPEKWGRVAQGLGATSGQRSHRWQVAGRGWHVSRSIQIIPPTLTQSPARSQHVAAEQREQFAPPSSLLLNLLIK